MTLFAWLATSRLGRGLALVVGVIVLVGTILLGINRRDARLRREGAAQEKEANNYVVMEAGKRADTAEAQYRGDGAGLGSLRKGKF